jgi:hypothetical protein
MLRGLSAEQIGREFGWAMRHAFERGLAGNPPNLDFCRNGCLNQAAKEGNAQYMHERWLTKKINNLKISSEV